MNEKTKPNIFARATKELSQDGFFAWLLEWANPDNKQYDKKLNACTQDFVKYLINKELEIKSVETFLQWEKIDICTYVNDKYLIIIEDKTFSGDNNPLESYKKKAENWCNMNKIELICIYLRTGTEKSPRKNIEEKGFRYIDRNDLIKFFGNPKYKKIKNDIYLDFIKNLENTLPRRKNKLNEIPLKKMFGIS